MQNSMKSSLFPLISAGSLPAAALRSRAWVSILCIVYLALGNVSLTTEANAADDGQVLWKFKASQEIRAPMAVSSDGVVYLPDFNRIKAFDGQTGNVRWTSPFLQPDYYSGPVVGRSGTVFVVTCGFTYPPLDSNINA